MSKRIDVLDHLVGTPEESVLRQRAREMYLSASWRMVSPWTKPADVAGEIDTEKAR